MRNINVARLSSLAWVSIGDTKYILDLPGRGFLRVVRDPRTGCYIGTETRRIPNSQAMLSTEARIGATNAFLRRPQTLFDKVESLEQAIAAASTYALVHSYRIGLLRTSAWRRGLVSSAQLQILAKLCADNVDMAALTKGQAADLITYLKHGGKGTLRQLNKRLKKEDVAKRRSWSAAQTCQSRLRREHAQGLAKNQKNLERLMVKGGSLNKMTQALALEAPCC